MRGVLKLSIHRQPTLLPGGRPIDPRRLYPALFLLTGFLVTFSLSVYSLYVVRDAGLTPMQLLLAGTAVLGSTFVFEIPTGVVADAYSRRLSLVVGYVIAGLGIAAIGVAPEFATIVAGQMVWGLGFTFLSGAREAWIADEIGEAEAAPVYLRAARFQLIGTIGGVPLGFALGYVSLQLPFLVGGALWVAAAVLIALTMTETGYRPAPSAERGTWRSMASTFRAGTRTIRGRGVLIAAVVVSLLMGTSSAVIDRLAALHLIEGIGLPSGIDDVTLFGSIQLMDVLGGIAAVWTIERVTDLNQRKSIARVLVVLFALIVVSRLAFGLATAFWFAYFVRLGARWASWAMDPLLTAWVNRGLDPSSRATVLSMVNQSKAAGGALGAPALGALASLRSVRTALVAAALLFSPSVLVFGREARRREDGHEEAAAPGD